MAKKSVELRNEKRKLIVAKFATVRAELKSRAGDFNISDEDRDEARRKLQALPRNSAK